MTADEKHLRKMRGERIRRVKFWLRPLPRRATIHRYPILNRFADFARKRIYLWSFRVENVVPALYAGCILTLLPIYGIQVPTALLLAVILHANLPILVGLQVVSNPFTVLPIWFTAYQVGRHFLAIFGIEALPLNRNEVRILLDNFTSGEWGDNLARIFSAFGVTSLGAIIIGTFIGLVASVTYRIVAKRTAASYAVLVEKIHEHQKNRKSP